MRGDRAYGLFTSLTVALGAIIVLEALRFSDGLQALNLLTLKELPYLTATWNRALTDSASLEAFALLAVVLYAVDAAADGKVSERTASFIVALIVSMIVTALLKAYTGVPRPMEPQAYFGLLGNLLNADYFSFPSGHTVRVTVLSYYVVSVFNNTKGRRASYLVIPYAGAIMVTRLLLREHWLSDIIGGILVGLWSSVLVEGPGRGVWRPIYEKTLGTVPWLRLS
ncbi:MAG: phosphatase PAP2 family protein [Acidilobus sp.]